VAAPTLLTEHLILMPLGPADLDEVAALYGDPEVMRHVVGGIRNRAETADALTANERHWKQNGWGLWALRDATTGGLVGEGGLQPFDELIGVPAEFGYTVGRRHWGRGLATEAGHAILDDLWDRYDGPTIHALVHPDNPPSRAVVKKLGFSEAGAHMLHGESQELWTLDRPV
jgi:RimJ/RimL family protein N-acetyltransferase